MSYKRRQKEVECGGISSSRLNERRPPPTNIQENEDFEKIENIGHKFLSLSLSLSEIDTKICWRR